MRLTDDQIKMARITYTKVVQDDFILDLIDTIEALQQENEQLQAQVARMRDALIIANNYMPDIGQFCVCGKCKGCGADIGYSGYEYCLKCARVIIDEALSDTPADYHNPADVEALRKAREVVRALNQADWCDCDHCKGVREAIAAIDKIGGREDV